MNSLIFFSYFGVLIIILGFNFYMLRYFWKRAFEGDASKRVIIIYGLIISAIALATIIFILLADWS